ncbi:MAG: SDR family NAD(P)-dependent oxidoreductase [Candidatus Rokubacteria bacterium]|nr:SDR family NAD(P)-dependent oxidoreductase [Candidatus Rokubacteria bacterium]
MNLCLTALITGGGSGIGRATALRFGREGCAVAVNDVNLRAAETVAAGHESRRRRRSYEHPGRR